MATQQRGGCFSKITVLIIPATQGIANFARLFSDGTSQIAQGVIDISSRRALCRITGTVEVRRYLVLAESGETRAT